MGRRYDTISFLSDYGTKDEFVGVVKSVIRSIAPAVAVIDITFILDNYARLKADGDRFKGEVEAMGKQFKAQQDTIVKGAEQLKKYNAGSPEFKKLEETLAQQQSDLKVQASLKEKEFAELSREFQRRQREFREDLNLRQNEENAAVIEKANKAIKQIAEAEKYDLILQDVVWVSPRLDITDRVIKALADGK